jgi:CubicO group peptidase (beta-lactamase class C family)
MAVVVAHRGRLVAERYRAGIEETTPLISWSMAKSVMAALVGIAAGEGRLSLDGPAPVPEWRTPGDARAHLTIDQLLRMSSGLAFGERAGATTDLSVMLFTRADAGAFAAGEPLAHPPESVWSYSSGTSNILSRILRDAFGRDLAEQVRWSRERLFDRIGMSTAIFETDASGSFVGSSFVFASARDWARFGQLHLQDGIWSGERVLPAGWVDYVRTPTPKAPLGLYGAHWWLNARESGAPEDRTWPSLPRDVFAARGMSGQYVVVVPSAELVVVRLGLAQVEDVELHGIERLVSRVLAAVQAEDREPSNATGLHD